MKNSGRASGPMRRGPMWPRGGVTKAALTKRPPARNPQQTGISAKSGSMLKSGS